MNNFLGVHNKSSFSNKNSMANTTDVTAGDVGFNPEKGLIIGNEPDTLQGFYKRVVRDKKHINCEDGALGELLRNILGQKGGKGGGRGRGSSEGREGGGFLGILG